MIGVVPTVGAVPLPVVNPGAPPGIAIKPTESVQPQATQLQKNLEILHEPRLPHLLTSPPEPTPRAVHLGVTVHPQQLFGNAAEVPPVADAVPRLGMQNDEVPSATPTIAHPTNPETAENIFSENPPPEPE
jgi:hypothetical protein